MQFAFAGAILYLLISSFSLTADVALFDGFKLQLPIAVYVAIMLLFGVGSANAINFTDGLDGLGDTGSLAIGGSLSFLAVIEKVEILIPILFSVYLAEQLSVILQVWYYKRTKLRQFRMAPIHYHFSLKYGWSENKIVMVFGFVSWLSVLICWLLWKFAL